jgi:hypothetical protein
MATRPDGRPDRPAGYEPVVVTGGIWLVAKLLRYAFPPLFPAFRTAFVSRTRGSGARTPRCRCSARPCSFRAGCSRTATVGFRVAFSLLAAPTGVEALPVATMVVLD